MAAQAMTGAESVLRTLSAGGVQACFANPGTSEMHLVAALDRCARCGRCSRCSRGSRRARPTATAGWPGSRRRRCCISGRGWGTRSRTSTTPTRRARPMVNVVGDHARGPRPAQRAAGERHRLDRPPGLALVRERPRRARRRGGRRRRRGGRPQPRGRDRDARRARRRRLGGERRAGGAAAGRAARRGAGGRRGRAPHAPCAPAGRPRCCWAAPRRAGPRCARPRGSPPRPARG